MGDLIARTLERPVVKHWLGAIDRFFVRLGAQFAAAITYFSVLSIIPTLMVAFAALGLTVTTFFPDALGRVKEWITTTISGPGLGDSLTAVVEQAFTSWQAVGVTGLLIAAWVGAGWVGNLRAAVRAMMRPSFDVTLPPLNPVLETLRNLGLLFLTFLLIAVSMSMTTVATTARDVVGDLTGLDATPLGAWLLSLVPVLGSTLAGFLLFAYLLTVFPERRVPPLLLLKGATLGAVGMTVLQLFAGLIVRLFAGNAAAAVFGSVIVVMLYLNLFATLILLVACWVALDPSYTPPSLTLGDHVGAHPTHYATKKVAAELAAASARAEREHVPSEVAARAARASLGVAALGGAAAVGVVATLVVGVSTLLGRRR